ncbi:MAG: phage holin family protein [Candidatus Latescibacterota bacterium]
MTSLLASLLINAGALAAATWMLDGITLQGATPTDRAVTLFVVAAVFGLVNAFVRPVVKVLSLPLYLLTLGLIAFVINGLMLLLTSWITGKLGFPFHVAGFWTAVGGSLVISVVSLVLGVLLRSRD